MYCVIRGLFIYEFAYSHFEIGQKWQFTSQKWTFNLQIQDLRSKMTEQSTTNNNEMYTLIMYYTKCRQLSKHEPLKHWSENLTL